LPLPLKLSAQLSLLSVVSSGGSTALRLLTSFHGTMYTPFSGSFFQVRVFAPIMEVCWNSSSMTMKPVTKPPSDRKMTSHLGQLKYFMRYWYEYQPRKTYAAKPNRATTAMAKYCSARIGASFLSHVVRDS
jgi:hypothetical protein